MEAVLLSMQPQHVQNICTIVGYENGKPVYKKTIEVRKTRPKLKLPFKCFIYCTKGNDTLNDTLMSVDRCYVLNGKVIGEFICDRIEGFEEYQLSPQGKFQELEQQDLETFLKASCLSYDEICDYRKNMPYFKPLYGWHISDLKIYDKPKELSELEHACNKDANCFYCEKAEFYGGCCNGKITRPPQSWQYVEV